MLSSKLAVPAPFAKASRTLDSMAICNPLWDLYKVRSIFTGVHTIGVPENGGRQVGPTWVPFTVTRRLVLAFAPLYNCFRSKVSHRESVAVPPLGLKQR